MKLSYLVIEYLPEMMHGEKMCPARIDGHYQIQAAAEGVAALWAEAPMHKGSRVVVAEIVHEAKRPSHWPEADL